MLFCVLLLAGATPLLARQAQTTSQGVVFLANKNHYPQNLYNDCWGYTAPDGREYALLGVRHGTSIVEITDPGDLVEIAFIPSANSVWKDIKTYQHYAYVVTDAIGLGLQIIDLSALPDSAWLASTYTNFATSHNIYIDEPNAMLYAEGVGGRVVRAISIEEPLQPKELSVFGIECHDMYARDNIVYVAEGNNKSVGIYDLSEPATPRFVSRFFIPNGGYVHNCWLSDDGNYLMTTEETRDRTVKMWDIRDLGDVKLLGEFLAPRRLAHNVYIKGQYAYIAHYENGLQILDISDPNNLIKVAELGTYSGPPSVYEGAWGAYPFFDSGKIIVSDINTGLYLAYFDGAVTSTGDGPGDASALPEAFALLQNYPNPFNPETTIRYTLREPADIRLAIYTASGTLLRILRQGTESAGDKAVSWDGRDANGVPAASGIYFYRLEARGATTSWTQTKKCLLLK